MTDSPTRKKRFGAGICWEWMDRGACPCDAGLRGFAGWHPKLSLSSSPSASQTQSPSPCTVASMPKRIPEWIESLKYLGFVEADPDNFAILGNSYEEREEVKTLGAAFAPGMRKWIVVAGQDLAPFAKWNPRINNRAVCEVVLHNPYIKLIDAMSELQHCGIAPSQMDVDGDGAEAGMLREEVSAMQTGPLASVAENANEPSAATDVSSKKRRPEGHNASASGGNEFAANKSPRFSTPRSMQTFVRQKQYEQIGVAERQVHGVASEVRADGGREQRDELPALLSEAKSALVRCINAGGISREQKQFNKAIYNVVDTLAIRISGAEKRDANYNRDNLGPSVNPRQTMVTPAHRINGGGIPLVLLVAIDTDSLDEARLYEC